MEDVSDNVAPRIRISIDRGGTFTDIYAEIDHPTTQSSSSYHTEPHVLKLLSVDPHNYADAPTEGIRRVLHIATGKEYPRNVPIDTSCIQSIRMGTTIATNALLERDGEPCALVATEGLKDMLAIGNQARPHIFDLRVKKMPPLYKMSVQTTERVRLQPSKVVHARDDSQAKSNSFEDQNDNDAIHRFGLEVATPLDVNQLTAELKTIKENGILSIAVAFMHSYAFRHHEHTVRDIAMSLGFKHVSLSSELTPMVKIVPRAFTATVDAYLTPKIRDYITAFKSGFVNNLNGVDVQFMQSDGGLCDIDSFCGYLAILSGPAGGVVGYARSAYGQEKNAPEVETSIPSMPVVGFDMGGTSTDVSRYDGTFEHVFETETAGVTIQAPQLDINTVAAGGGSRLQYRTGMFYVGPESAGAHPGPVCYRKGGHLTVTDANLMLGRIEPSLFPKIFGENADQPLDAEGTRVAFNELTKEINKDLETRGEPFMSPEQIAEGFIKVANEAMCRPIRQLTESKGHDVREHLLASFGGAGGQHACAIARSLGIKYVFIHKYSGVLSAYGIALADSVIEVQEPFGSTFSGEDTKQSAFKLLGNLHQRALESLTKRGFDESAVRYESYYNLRYVGTDFGLMIRLSESAESGSSTNCEALFVSEYEREHGFHIPNRDIVLDDVRVRAFASTTGSNSFHAEEQKTIKIPVLNQQDNNVVSIAGNSGTPILTSKCYYSDEGGWVETPVWSIDSLEKGVSVLRGPCLIVDSHAGNTIVVDPYCVARINSEGNILIDIQPLPSSEKAKAMQVTAESQVDHVKLSIYAHRFMGIAEQMGRTLQRTAISTNIKERLDFSCALFDETGGLVANAPHVPVHLGAMQDAVRYQIRALGQDWAEGEVLLTNHPEAGGTHLPDITVITPVYHEGKVVFYVASRGHHADIGGITPGSMPPFSKNLSEEGLAVKSMKLVKQQVFQEEEIKKYLEEAGCRCIKDVITDLVAQVAANKKGITLVSELIKGQGLGIVVSYMHHIQNAAADAVKEMLRTITKRHPLASTSGLHFCDYMDDGSKIQLKLTINEKNGTATFDFTGSSPEVVGNTNAPKAVTSSAVIYALRCLVDIDIPLNQGCLDPIQLVIPENSILAPSSDAAVVGGNVLTSQRVTDVILGAFGACAASQGCMNNLTFGDDSMGYYETIGGGCGAGPGWNGTSGVQTHMTNTRITDPEILERRYPAVVREFAIRPNSGGMGKWRGGDGLIRAIEFTKPVTVSLLTERRSYAPWGLEGGNEGASGKNELLQANGDSSALEGKCSFTVNAGDVVHVSTPGGGGYGT